MILNAGNLGKQLAGPLRLVRFDHYSPSIGECNGGHAPDARLMEQSARDPCAEHVTAKRVYRMRDCVCVVCAENGEFHKWGRGDPFTQMRSNDRSEMCDTIHAVTNQ